VNNTFWRDENLNHPLPKAWGRIFAIALGVYLGIQAASCGQNNTPEEPLGISTYARNR